MGLDITGIGSVASLIQDGIDKIFPSKTDEQKAQAALLLTQVQGAIANAEKQLDVNAAEAANTSILVAGWRPAIGWICGFSFGWVFVLQPMLAFALVAIGHPIKLPDLDMSQMMPVLLGILGLGGMHSYERVKGVSKGRKSDG